MRKLIGSLLLLWIFGAHAAETMRVNVDASQPQFVVRLPANATTGYQWSIKKYDKKRFNLLSSQYVAPQVKLIGAGGEMVYTFALQEGQTYPKKTTMIFKYARSWESKGATIKQVTITFNSKK